MATKKSIPPKRKTEELKGRFTRTLAWVEFTIAKYRQEHHITDGGEAALDSIANSSAVIDADGGRVPADSKVLGTATALQYDRYMQRNVMRSVLRGTRPARCGRVLRASDGIRLWWDRENGSRLSNLQTCGSVWVCPVCNHKIQTARCDEVRTMLEHCKEHGWGVVFATHTVRHNRRESLLDVRHMANTIWSAVATHRVVRRMKSIVGIIGYLRATEVTWSKANGWHVHYHVYWITLEPMAGRTVEVPVYKRRKDHTAYVHHFDKLDAFEYFRDTFTRDWVDTSVKKGFAAPRFANQVFEQIDFTKESTIQAAARYCTSFKSATTPLTSRLGHELTDTQAKVGKVKRHANGKDVLHLTYWDFVRILSDPNELTLRTLSDFTAITVTARCRCVDAASKQPYIRDVRTFPAGLFCSSATSTKTHGHRGTQLVIAANNHRAGVKKSSTASHS